MINPPVSRIKKGVSDRKERVLACHRNPIVISPVGDPPSPEQTQPESAHQEEGGVGLSQETHRDQPSQ